MKAVAGQMYPGRYDITSTGKPDGTNWIEVPMDLPTNEISDKKK